MDSYSSVFFDEGDEVTFDECEPGSAPCLELRKRGKIALLICFRSPRQLEALRRLIADWQATPRGQPGE